MDNTPMRIRVAYAINLHLVNIMVMADHEGEKVQRQFYVNHCNISVPSQTELTEDPHDPRRKRMYVQCYGYILEMEKNKLGTTLTIL